MMDGELLQRHPLVYRLRLMHCEGLQKDVWHHAHMCTCTARLIPFPSPLRASRRD